LDKNNPHLLMLISDCDHHSSHWSMQHEVDSLQVIVVSVWFNFE